MEINIGAALETIGRVTAAGYGDQVLLGIILGLIEGVTPGELYAYIRDNIDLVNRVSEYNWQLMRRISNSMNLNEISLLRIQDELRESRLDLLSVIINTSGGNEWVESQLEKAKAKLRG